MDALSSMTPDMGTNPSGAIVMRTVAVYMLVDFLIFSGFSNEAGPEWTRPKDRRAGSRNYEAVGGAVRRVHAAQ